MKNLGLKNINVYHLYGTNLKKDLLYFDEIIINEDNFRLLTGVASGTKDSRHSEMMNFNLSEIEFLEKKGLVRIENVPKYFENLGGSTDLDLIDLNTDIKNIRANFNDYTSDERVNIVTGLFSIHNVESNLNSRIFCSDLNEKGILNIKPIIEINQNDRKFLPNLSDSNIDNYSKDVDVVNLVLKNIPVPNELVSWEKIIDFKKNTDLEIYRLGLLNWVAEMGKADLSQIELQQKLEYLIKQYEENLKLAKIKFHTGTTELIITTTIEVIENVVKLNWSKAVKSLFNISKRKVDLMIGETLAPGREVAYISKIRNQLG